MSATVVVIVAHAPPMLLAWLRRRELSWVLGTALVVSGLLFVLAFGIQEWQDWELQRAYQEGYSEYQAVESRLEHPRRIAVWLLREALVVATLCAFYGAWRRLLWVVPVLVLLVALWAIILLMFAVGVPRIV